MKHDINFTNGNVIKRSGNVARLTEKVEFTGQSINGVEIFVKKFGKFENLPEPKGNTYYVVSLPVVQHEKLRDDLLCPGDLVRNEKGMVIGCKSLVKISSLFYMGE